MNHIGEIEITEEGKKLAKKVFEAQDIIYTFLTEILEVDKETAEIEAKKMKLTISDEIVNKLARYVSKEIGVYSLDCGYDINNEKCIDCKRREKIKKGEMIYFIS